MHSFIEYAFQDNLLTLSDNFNKTQICEKLFAPMPCPRTEKSTSLSQQLTRENSKDSLPQDNNSMAEASSKFESDQDFTVGNISHDGENEPNSDVYQRTHDQARISYINKLVNMKILDLKPKKKSQNVFIFDWDDTLFCTSCFGNTPICKIPENLRSLLGQLDITASRLLLKAEQAGDVFIITNSDKGWVEQSSKNALPKTYQAIKRRNIKVISARKHYGVLFPNDMYRWKLEAFLSLKRQFDQEVITNLVVIGDSDIEIEAARQLGQQFKRSFLKTVQMKRCPKVDELVKEQNILTNLFDEIFTSCKNMTVKLGKRTSL